MSRTLCTREKLTVLDVYECPYEMEVWRYREFAVFPDSGGWRVVFVPMGMGLDPSFATEEQAIGFMIEFDKLKNNWRELTLLEWKDAIESAAPLFARFGSPVPEYEEEHWRIGAENLNGYA